MKGADTRRGAATPQWFWILIIAGAMLGTWGAFGDGFDRVPTGLRDVTWSALRADAERLTEVIRQEWASFRADAGSWSWFFQKILPLCFLALVGGLLWWLERQAKATRQKVLKWLPDTKNKYIISARTSLLDILTRSLPMALPLLPLYVPLKLIYPTATWLDLAIHFLWIVLIYRALCSLVEDVLLEDLLRLPRKPTDFKRWFHRGLKIAVALWLAQDVVNLFQISAGGGALLELLLRLWITVRVAQLATLSDDILLLFTPLRRPEAPRLSLMQERAVPLDVKPLEPGAEKTDKRTYIKVFVIFSSLMCLLWSVGYEAALSTILMRVAAAIGVLLLAIFGYRRVQRWVHALVERQLSPEGEPRDREHYTVLRAIERSVLSVGGTILCMTLFNILGIWQGLVEVISGPALEIGTSIRISLYAIGKGVFGMMCVLFLSNIARAVFNEKVYPKFEVDIGVGYAINTMVHYLMFTVGLVMALNAIGVDVAALGLFFSALGVGIGLGLQPIVRNLMSGFILLFGRSLKKGDFITINNVYGRVDTVGARSVTITTPDNVEMIIPSADLISAPIINWTLSSPTARIKIPVGVAYGSDVQLVKIALIDAALRHPLVQRRPAPEAWMIGFEASRIQFQLLFYIDCRQINEARAIGEVHYHIWDALRAAHIEVPFPQTDLHIKDFIKDFNAPIPKERPADTTPNQAQDQAPQTPSQPQK